MKKRKPKVITNSGLNQILGVKSPMKIFQNAPYWFILPLAIIFIALVCGTVYSQTGNKYDGFANIGVDFKGGTVLTIEMTGVKSEDKDRAVTSVLDLIETEGLQVTSNQTSGSSAIIIRYPNSVIKPDGSIENLNTTDKTPQMLTINSNLEDKITNMLKTDYGADKNVTANAELINATASSDLIKKAALSVGIALAIMLIYTAIRFDFFSGISALLIQINDIIIMLALVIIFRIQINSAIIAGLITIVAYSINNTLLVFDRIRSNMAIVRAQNFKIIPGELVDLSVTQSLTRMIFSSITTLLTISILAMMGVRALTEFALPIIFGVLSGLYSSLFLAPSIWGTLMNLKLNKAPKKAKSIKR
ncbi:MAG TPA: protein translocase subunit SecF [Clostridia bacterium]|jgi:preprotein translocase SecF subunit|nr:protein translocase subunit SecF [Clostridia bacterium]